MTTETATPTNPFIPMTFNAYVDKAMTYRMETADAQYARENL